MYSLTHMLKSMNVPNSLPGIYIKRLRNSNLVGRLEVLSGRMFLHSVSVYLGVLRRLLEIIEVSTHP